MLLVKTKLGLSKVGGIGLFAGQFIPKGTMTFKFIPELDKAYDEKEIEMMSPAAKDQFLNYAYFDPNLAEKKFVLCFDDGRFINHSKKPNIRSSAQTQTDVAIRDIHEGEELFCDYRDYEEKYFERRNIDENKFQ